MRMAEPNPVRGGEWSGRQVLVVGMARSGLAVAQYLHRRGARVVITDQRPAQELSREIRRLLEMGVAIETGGHGERSFQEAEIIVVSPGVPAQLPELEHARSRGIPVWGELELATRGLPGRLAAITGSNGKTTTTSLTGHLLRGLGGKVLVGGNIGVPLIGLAEEADAETITVAETSSFQLETVRDFHAQAVAVLNLTPDHLDRHGTLEAYIAAKRKIFANQTAADFAILNAEDAVCRDFAAATPARKFWFDASGAKVTAGMMRNTEAILWKPPGRAAAPLLTLDANPLRGRHNLENAMAALAITAAMFFSDRQPGAEQRARLATALRSFRAVEHRLEFVARMEGVDYYNDSKATNVDATLKALEAFAGGLWVILGGKDKNSDYRPLAEPLRQRARGVLLIGAAAEKIAQQLEAAQIAVQRTHTLARALATAREQARPGETVLLAPACASFDQFQNYEHRGQIFKQIVREWEAAAGQSPQPDEPKAS